MFRIRTAAAVGAAALIGAGVLAGCSSSSDTATDEASASAEATDSTSMLPPVIIAEDQAAATCKVGDNLDILVAADKLAGTTVAAADATLVELTQGGQDGDAFFNPGGKCLAAGETTLTVTGPDSSTRDITLTITE